MSATVKNQICSQCGTEVRPGSLFCYHCGNSVAPENAAVKIEKIERQTNGGNQTAQPNLKIETADKPIPKPVPTAEPKLQSAAAMRRKSKKPVAQRTEIIWEEYEGAPNVWFVAAAIVLIVLAIGILYLAMNLK